jgi:hypothetical protein
MMGIKFNQSAIPSLEEKLTLERSVYSSDKTLEWHREEESKKQHHIRSEEAKDKRLSRLLKGGVVSIFLLSAMVITGVSSYAFLSSNDASEKKTAINAASTALTTLAGFAAGLGLR